MTKKELRNIARSYSPAYWHSHDFSVKYDIGYFQPSNANWSYKVQVVRFPYESEDRIVVTRFGCVCTSNLY